MMRGAYSLRIDFQQRAGASRRAFGRLLLALGCAMLAAAGARYAALGSDAAVLQEQLAAAQRREPQSVAAGHAAGEGKALDERVRAADRVLDQLTVPWGTLLADVERAADASVAVLSLQTDPTRRAVRLTGEARDFVALMAYVRRLEEAAALSDVQLAGHEVRQQDPRRPVAFALTATWTIER